MKTKAEKQEYNKRYRERLQQEKLKEKQEAEHARELEVAPFRAWCKSLTSQQWTWLADKLYCQVKDLPDVLHDMSSILKDVDKQEKNR